MNGSRYIGAKALAAAVVAVAVCCPRGFAADTTWQLDPATSGDWATAGNWTGGLPTGSVRGYIENGGTALITTNFSGWGGSVYVGNVGSGSIIQTAGTYTGGGLYIGESAGIGSYELSGGTLSASVMLGQRGTGTFVQSGSSTATLSLRIGGYATGSGHYLLQSGTLGIPSSAVDLDVEGRGLFEQTGGTYNGSYVHLGYGSYGDSIFRVTGGDCLMPWGTVFAGVSQGSAYEARVEIGGTAHAEINSLEIGQYARGRYVQTGGVCTSVRLRVSQFYDGGVVDLQGGTLTASQVIFGNSSYPTGGGTYRQSGGLLQAGTFTMTPGSRIEFSGGQIATTRGLICPGTFDFTAPGGTLELLAGSSLDLSKAGILHPGNGRINAAANTLILLPAGFDTGSLAGYTSAGVTHVAGTAMEVAAGQTLTAQGSIDGYVRCLGSLKVGNTADSLTVSKGVEVPAGGVLDLGIGSVTVETATGGVSGGSLSGSSMKIGAAGAGTFTQSAGTTTLQQTITLGEAAGSSGRLDITGGEITAYQMRVGQSGSGRVVQTGGLLTADRVSGYSGQWSLAVTALPGATASYELGGTGRMVLDNASIGDFRGYGLFVQTGGDLTIHSGLSVGHGQYNGRYEMSGGTIHGGYLGVGDYDRLATDSWFVQTGGSIAATWVGANTGGTWLLTGTGEITTESLGVRGGTTALFRQEAGVCRVSGELHLGDYPGGGRYELAGGVLTSGQTVVTDGTFQQTGGSHTVGVLTTATAGRYELGAAALAITGSWANAGTTDFLSAAGSVTVADNGFVDFRGGSILNSANASMTLGTRTYMIVPTGFDPATAFHTFSSGGIVHTIGTTMVIPAGYDLKFTGDLVDPVDCSGKLSAVTDTALNLTNGLVLRSGGTVDLQTGNLTVKDSTSGSTSGSLKVNYISVGPDRPARFTQSGGTVQVAWDVSAGGDTGGDGTYVLDGGGTLSTYTTSIGGLGTGRFVQNSGSFSSEAYIYVGGKTGAGTYELKGGSVFSDRLYVGGVPDFYGRPGTGDGHWVQTGGTFSASYIRVQGVAGDSTIDVSGGTMTTKATFINGINSAWGIFRQSGGQANVTGTDYYNGLILGEDSNQKGRYELSGTGRLNARNLFVGQDGAGTVVQTGGAATVSDKLSVGHWDTAQGDYQLDGGTLQVNGNEYVGYFGTGRFVQTGGTNTSPRTYLGYQTPRYGPASGSYDLRGGTLQPGEFHVGYGGVGAFTQGGGTNTAGSLTLGTQAGARGTYLLSSGTLQPGQTRVGDAGAGTFTQSGGTSTPSSLTLGWQAGANGQYVASGGSLTVTGATVVGKDGAGTFRVTGPGATIRTGTYTQGAAGALVSEVTAAGLASVHVTGNAALDGTWSVLDAGAPKGKFLVLQSDTSITGAFDSVQLPGPDWSWKVVGSKALWLGNDTDLNTTRLAYRVTYMGGGVKGYEFRIVEEDGAQGRYQFTLGWRGVGGATVHQILDGDDEGIDSESTATYFDGRGDPVYRKNQDSWLSDLTYLNAGSSGKDPFVPGGHISGIVHGDNLYEVGSSTGLTPSGDGTVVAYIVADGNVEWGGYITRSGVEYYVSGVTPEPCTAALLAAAAIAVLRRRSRRGQPG